jgi:DNA-directed RNA polymerase specialized sigma24 family protein
MSDEEVVRSILDMLTPREREALHRFYVLGQTKAQIVREMGFDEKALQELKARAKKQFSLWKGRLK